MNKTLFLPHSLNKTTSVAKRLYNPLLQTSLHYFKFIINSMTINKVNKVGESVHSNLLLLRLFCLGNKVKIMRLSMSYDFRRYLSATRNS